MAAFLKGGRGVLVVMHGRISVTIDPRIATVPGRSVVGFSPTRQASGIPHSNCTKRRGVIYFFLLMPSSRSFFSFSFAHVGGEIDLKNEILRSADNAEKKSRGEWDGDAVILMCRPRYFMRERRCFRKKGPPLAQIIAR